MTKTDIVFCRRSIWIDGDEDLADLFHKQMVKLLPYLSTVKETPTDEDFLRMLGGIDSKILNYRKKELEEEHV